MSTEPTVRPATRREIWTTIATAITTAWLPVPSRVVFIDDRGPDLRSMVCLDLDTTENAEAWARWAGSYDRYTYGAGHVRHSFDRLGWGWTVDGLVSAVVAQPAETNELAEAASTMQMQASVNDLHERMRMVALTLSPGPAAIPEAASTVDDRPATGICRYCGKELEHIQAGWCDLDGWFTCKKDVLHEAISERRPAVPPKGPISRGPYREHAPIESGPMDRLAEIGGDK